MGSSTEICYWRELWRLTSGFTPSDLVTHKLKGVQNQLEHGLCYYKPSSAESYTKFASDHKKFEKVLPFIEKLQQYMGLETSQTWDIFCHYLSSQYHGTAENSLQNFIFMDVRISQLLVDVWNFYNFERMFMLKQLKLMLEFKDSKHIYEKEFNSVISSIGLDKLTNSLMKQFEYLVKENPPSKIHNGEMVTLAMQKTWMERNLREQVEVLLLILLVVDERDLTIQEFKKLFSLFKIHNFGRQPTYSKYLEDAHHSAILKIVYCEVALFYKIVNDSKSLNVCSVIQHIKEDIESELIRLQHNEEHGALLLVWMLLLLQDPQGEEMFLTRCQHFGTKALQLRVFEFIYKMITHSMFSDNGKCATIVRRSVYHILGVMCDKFDGDGSVAGHASVIELCAELLTDPKLASAFWNSVNDSEAPGIISLWNTALEFFPYDFKTICMFITGLSKASTDSLQTLLCELETLPVYTELYKPGMVGVSNVMDDEDGVVLTENYYPYGDKALCVRARSAAAIMDRRNVTLIHFRRPVSYWRILQHEIEDLLNATIQGHTNIVSKIERVLWGIRALVAVLNRLTPGDGLPDALVGPCEVVFDVLVRFAHSKTPLLPLIAACLDVSTALVPNFTQRIYIRLMNIRLLPSIEFTNLSHEDYASGASFQTSTLGLYLVNVEQPSGEYPILNSYIDMLFAFYDCNYDRDISMGVLLPGLVFILREVFPHMAGWFYKTPQAKYALTLKCVTYLLKVSQLSPEQTTRPADLLLNKTCVFSLLNLENGMALLKLISLGEHNIQAVMENETNWIHGPGIEYIKMVQMSMAVLMQVLRLKTLVREKTAMGPLEHLIYTQPKQKDALKIVPIVAGYINHVFNQQLPNTACRLLRRFALEFQMSLLVCLDMTPHQIRTMFLERLRDESESASLKTVILEFVAACVEKQPGLTEAFFKVSHPQDENRIFHSEKKSDRTDGILTYMAEYLAAVKNNTNSLYSPLLSRIMGLFHALWKNNMQILVKDLRENEDFWEYMCSPLFQDILPDIKAYSQIFNMMAIELYLFEGKIDKSLRAALEKLFSRDGKHLRRWVEYIFSFDGRKSTLNAIDEVPGWLGLLTSWKDFTSIIIKYLPFPVTHGNKSLMVGHCLDALNKEMERMTDGRTIVILSEMYVVFFSSWKEDCFDDRKKYFNQIATLLNHTAAAFDGLHSRAKNSILAISTLSLNMLAYDSKTENDLCDEIIRSVCTITCSQLDKMYSDEQDESMVKDDTNIKSSENDNLNPIVLGLRLLEQCINVFKDSFIGWSHWFMSTRLINKLVFFVSSSVRKKSMLRQTLAAFNCLTAFARSTVSKDILHCDISQHLWLQLLPPKELSQTNSAKQSESQWQVNEWLQVYKCGIEFVTAMLENHGNFFSSDAILFVGVQEDYLNESILLIRQSLDMDALNLTNSALYFISELVKYESKWRQEHFQSMVALMRSISVCFHYCITMVLRPKGIHLSIESPSSLLTQDETDNAGPSPKVTTTLNKLLELMHLSAVCLKAFSPDLLTLLADPCPDLSKWQPLMELQFSAPKLSDDPFPQLTFGTVMSAVCFLTRSLNYNYHADETPLNSVRKQSGRKGSLRRRISGGGGLGGDESIRRRTLRSDSVTSLSSTTSTVTIGPSWLAALDKRLVLLTLENILTLLASQALLAAKDVSMSSRDKQLVRRELCTELPIFHDFVRKKVLDLSHPKNYLARKKFGAFPLMRNDEECKDLTSAQESNKKDDSMEIASNTPPRPTRLSFDSMRVSVVRKLHLDKTRTKQTDPVSTPKKFAGVDQYSPIQAPYDVNEQGKPSALTSTPTDALKQTPGTSRTSKHVTWDDISVSPPEEEQLLEPIDPEYSPLSEVQILEEDYFHFLSNVFLYFCQTDI